MGCAESRDKARVVKGAPAEENFCYTAECQIGLHKVDFITYQAAVKRFGYRVNMNKEHMRAISKEINLDFERMYEYANSPYAIAYLDQEFTFKGDVFHVDRLVILGWILCRHWSQEE